MRSDLTPQVDGKLGEDWHGDIYGGVTHSASPGKGST